MLLEARLLSTRSLCQKVDSLYQPLDAQAHLVLVRRRCRRRCRRRRRRHPPLLYRFGAAGLLCLCPCPCPCPCRCCCRCRCRCPCGRRCSGRCEAPRADHGPRPLPGPLQGCGLSDARGQPDEQLLSAHHARGHGEDEGVPVRSDPQFLSDLDVGREEHVHRASLRRPWQPVGDNPWRHVLGPLAPRSACRPRGVDHVADHARKHPTHFLLGLPGGLVQTRLYHRAPLHRRSAAGRHTQPLHRRQLHHLEPELLHEGVDAEAGLPASEAVEKHRGALAAERAVLRDALQRGDAQPELLAAQVRGEGQRLGAGRAHGQLLLLLARLPLGAAAQLGAMLRRERHLCLRLELVGQPLVGIPRDSAHRTLCRSAGARRTLCRLGCRLGDRLGNRPGWRLAVQGPPLVPPLDGCLRPLPRLERVSLGVRPLQP
eukprot:scaffold78413_cov67-Phaeocystis_antarctica.AAC.2